MNTKLIASVFKKEVRELVRDPYSIGTALFLPVIMLFLFGYALNFDIRETPIVVMDLDQSAVSRNYAAVYDQSEYFAIVSHVESEAEIKRLMEQGKAKAGLIIPAGFSDNLYRAANGQLTMPPAQVQTLVDGSFSPTAAVIIDYINAINQQELIRYLQERNVEVEQFLPIQVEERIWYNPSLMSENFIIPGLFAVLLMVFPPLLAVLAVVREKERGSIQQIYISPIRPFEFLAGKLLPYGILAIGEFILIFIATIFLFNMEYRGSILLFLTIGIVYVFTTVGIGLLISTLMKTQLAAMFLTIIVTTMPSMLFSGFLYPISTMPSFFNYYSYLFPARFFVDISRDILVKGLDFRYIWFDSLLLIAYTGIILALATWRFKKRIG